MKRELKRIEPPALRSTHEIAKPIPMKRELKRYLSSRSLPAAYHCKAYPDEKGIETKPLEPEVRIARAVLQSLSR